MVMAAPHSMFRSCRICGAAFEVTVHEQRRLVEQAAKHGWESPHLPARCPACRGRALRGYPNGPATPTGRDIRLTCLQCGRPFVFDADDQEYFSQQRWAVPRRCRRCRRRSRERLAAEPGAASGANTP